MVFTLAMPFRARARAVLVLAELTRYIDHMSSIFGSDIASKLAMCNLGHLFLILLHSSQPLFLQLGDRRGNSSMLSSARSLTKALPGRRRSAIVPCRGS